MSSLKPPLKVASRPVREPGGIHGGSPHLPGPGSSAPGCSWNLTSRWSSETMPAAYEVCTESGRRKVPNTAGSPLTVSSTRHAPSPGSAGPAGELSRAGMIGVNPRTGVYLGRSRAADGTVKENCGLPPTLGGLYVSHSPKVTTGPR